MSSGGPTNISGRKLLGRVIPLKPAIPRDERDSPALHNQSQGDIEALDQLGHSAALAIAGLDGEGFTASAAAARGVCRHQRSK